MRHALFAVLMACSTSAFAGANFVSGNITNHTSMGGTVNGASQGFAPGLYITLNTGLPDNCVGSPYGWMVIPEFAKTMIAVTLLAKTMNKQVTVYTDGRTSLGGLCTVNQVDPYE